MLGWDKIEELILSKIGVFSYFNFGLLDYVPFLLFFSLCLIAVYVFNQSKYAKKGKSGVVVGCKKIGFIVYGTVFFVWVGVGLYVLILHFYIQNFVPNEVVERLTFLTKPEIVAIEGFIEYPFFLFIPLLFLIKDRDIQSMVGLRSRHSNVKKNFLLYIFYLSALLISLYLISKISIPPSGIEKYSSLVSVFQGMRTKFPVFAYTYMILMVILISFSKELLFRGFIYSCLRENIGIKYAFILQCLLFSLYHQDSGWLIFLITGIFLTLLYEQTKSIYLPIVVHGSLLFFTIILNI
ncbi:MAG: CPBP family intramembrane metalloprotease [Deltaproteobacteria bacterium]|nr:CPBP family intramembrane metalloprotease [Deltaproteobacteria bacterium]